MIFYLLLTLQYNTDAADKKSIYEATTLNEALALYHSELGKAMKDEKVSHALCMVINSEGGLHASESYHKEV